MTSPLRRLNLPLLLVVVIWGANYTSIKLGVRELPPMTWAAIRFTVAGAILFGVVLWRKIDPLLNRGDWAMMALAGAVCFGFGNMLFTVGLRYTTATNSSLILSSSPVITALIAWATGAERLRPAKALGVLLSFVGMAIVLTLHGAELAADGATLRGDLLSITGAVLVGGYPVAIHPMVRRYSSLTITAWTFLFSSLALWGLAWTEFAQLDLARLTILTPGTLLYSAVLAASFAQVLWNDAVGRLGATQVVVYLYLPPLVAAGIAAVALGERLGLSQLVGAVVIFVGLYLVKRPEAGPVGRPLDAAGH